MRGVVRWLRPGSRFAFQRQVHQMHRTDRTQGIIFADVQGGLQGGLEGGLRGNDGGNYGGLYDSDLSSFLTPSPSRERNSSNNI